MKTMRFTPLLFALAISSSLFSSTLLAQKDLGLYTELSAKQRRKVAIPSVAPLVDKAAPASVFITAIGQAPQLPKGHPQMPQGPSGKGQGSGFVIHPSGLVLTNNHVIEAAQKITVRVGKGSSEWPATIVGTDPKTDVALLQITPSEKTPKKWKAMPLGDSESLRVGDVVVAIGSPFGLQNSVSMGIISGRGRRDINPNGRSGLYDFLQTDASINPGNSGGPLLNLSGEVVGINTAINAAASGIGFAIPIALVKRMLPALKKDGKVTRSWLGVAIQKVSPELAAARGLKEVGGALIQRVADDSPSQKAGILAGDIITTFDGIKIADASELPFIAGDAGVGHKAKVSVVRGKERKTLIVDLGAHPDNLVKAQKSSSSKPVEKPKRQSLGISVVTLDNDDRERLGLGKKTMGVRVVRVVPGSPAFLSGLRPDDVVQKANGVEMIDADTFARLIKKAPSGMLLELFVLRNNSSTFVALTLP